MFISSSTYTITSTELSANKHQPKNADIYSSFNDALAEKYTQIKISETTLKGAQENVVSSGGFAMRHSAIEMNDETLRNFLKEMVYEEISGEADAAGGLLDLTDWINGGTLRYSNTGEPVTSESRAYFNSKAKEYKAQKISIFESEISNGTPLIDIYDKLTEATSKQSQRFLGMIGYIKK